jgi:phosphoribosyl-dephospho-CoA transferase
LQDLPLVPDWALKGWPVIIRRRAPGDAAGCVPAALPLPPSFGKRRVGISLGGDTRLEALPPVTLAQAAGVAPLAWQPAITVLLALGRDIGVAPRVFGALLWEKLTGLAYLTGASDLDLLWRADDEARTARLLAGLLDIDRDFLPTIDGELELPDGAGVSWRELAACLASGQDKVLAKSIDTVTTRSIAQLFPIALCAS